MAVVYLHIGTMKTGTSAIQYFLHRNEAVLRENGFCFPVTGNRAQGVALHRNGHFLVYRSRNADPVQKAAEVAQARELGFKAVEEAAGQYENIVLTDEAIWQFSHTIENFWGNLVEDLKKINCELRVIVYFRRQDQMVESYWKQVVKTQQCLTMDFMDWIRGEKYRRLYLDYYKELSAIARSVGKENIIVRVYEKGQYGSSIYEDILGSMGLPLTEAYQFPEADNVMAGNLSLQGNFVEIKRVINGIREYKALGDFLYHPVMYASNYQATVHPPEQTTLFSSYEEQTAFLEQFQEGNRKVAEEYLGREDGRLFYQPVEPAAPWKVDPARLPEDLLTTVVEAFCRQENMILYQKGKIQAQQQSIASLGKQLKETQDQVRELKARLAQLDQMKEEMALQKKDLVSMYNSVIFRAYRKLRKMLGKQEY